MPKGIIFLVGPSAVGKTEVRKHLTSATNCKFIPSFTTRPARESEENGKDYFFITNDQFEKLKVEGQLLEWEEHFGNYYGISKETCRQLLTQSDWLVKEIQIDGYLQSKENLDSDINCVSIFIKPDDSERLVERIAERGGEGIPERILSIKKEMESLNLCDYQLTSYQGELSRLKDEAEKIVRKLINNT